MTTLDTRKMNAPDVGPPPKRHRARKVAVIMAMIIGLGGIAAAATYLWGTITGTATVNDSTATISITSVVGSDLTGANAGGINCSPSTKGIAGQAQQLNLVAIAYRVTVNGTPPGTDVDLGNCTVLVGVQNTGVAPAQVSAVLDAANAIPTGWTFTANPPVTINAGDTATLTIKLTANGTASGSHTFGGRLNVDIPPLGA